MSGQLTVDRLIAIKEEANRAKKELFNGVGWKMNHLLTEGDVSLVLRAIKKLEATHPEREERGRE